ncbi:TIGR03943 family putative permease subunit [Microbacterium sp. NPDC091313]
MPESRVRSLATRWLGVGLASCLAVITIGLAVTGRIGLYLNPDSAWFAVGMAVLVLVGAVASFALPLGAEDDHGHDHGVHAHDDDDDDHDHAHGHPARPLALTATVAGGVLASGVVLTMVLTPPASLSADLAMSRDIGAAPLFAGQDVLTLAATADTSTFGIGDWAGVFASATDPDKFDGDPVTLTGFVTPGSDGGFDLTRLVITHCVIDAQTASLPVASSDSAPSTGQWVTITGTVRSDSGGGLRVQADQVTAIDEPQDPYEY